MPDDVMRSLSVNAELVEAANTKSLDSKDAIFVAVPSAFICATFVPLSLN